MMRVLVAAGGIQCIHEGFQKLPCQRVKAVGTIQGNDAYIFFPMI